jgi:hypothetical protein
VHVNYFRRFFFYVPLEEGIGKFAIIRLLVLRENGIGTDHRLLLTQLRSADDFGHRNIDRFQRLHIHGHIVDGETPILIVMQHGKVFTTLCWWLAQPSVP